MKSTVIVKNNTTLTDYCVLIRAGLYLSGKREEAEQEGIRFKVKETITGKRIITVTEENPQE